MIFTANLADRDYLRGHFALEDVRAETGERREHCWINQDHEGVIYLPIPCRIRIDGAMRKYTRKDGTQSWTISRIVEVKQIE